MQLETIAGDIDSNINKVEKLLLESKNSDADLIILPELWTTGWDCPNFKKYSEEIEVSKAYNFLKNLAVKFKSNVIGGSAILHEGNEKSKNTCLIFNRTGELITKYSKFHLFSLRGQSEGVYLEEGTTPVIAKTDIGNIGISICYDIRFPEMFRLYAFNGTDFMVNMAAWPNNYVEEYVTLIKARAIENQTYFISASLTGKIDDKYSFAGNSSVIDYQGRTIKKLESEEKVLCCTIDIDKMKEYREQMPILNDTKQKYQILEP